MVAEHHDVIVSRPGPDGVVPAAFSARGWDGFLLGLDDAEVARAELEGPGTLLAGRAASSVPATLLTLLARAGEVTALPRLSGTSGAQPTAQRRASLRKQQQVAALVQCIGAHPRL